jgi:uncharacterized protein (TIGR03437 family)
MKFIPRFLSLLLAAAASWPLVQVCRAQNQTSVTQILPVPDGGQFYVDGQYYSHGTSAVWPTGSAHTLYAVPQGTPAVGTQYVFQTWQWSGGTLAGNPVIVTADPTIKEYQAMFVIQYSLNLVFFTCTSNPCQSPGTVYLNGAPYTSDAQIYVSAGSSIVLQAQPAPGYVFAGWGPGIAQTIQGFQDTVTVTSPVSVYPIFKPARPINLATVPAGLQLLADQALVTTPVTLQWGYDTVHNLAPVSPQNDQQGVPWVFSSWSNSGAAIQSYTVAELPSPDTVTATFVPGAPIDISTVPAGLSLSVDGRSNWPSFNFLWGVGQSHTLAAPAQQIDANGGVWAFANWSDGGAASHSYTVPQAAAGTGAHLVATYTPVGHLTITSALAGLSVTVDGAACAVPCDVLRPTGTTVNVSAPASAPVASGSRQDFLGWSNGASSSNLSLTLGATPVSIAANYHLMNLLATATAPSGAASWTLAPASPDGYYDSQTTVAVSVTALPGFHFQSWSGDLSGPTPSGVLAMAAPHAVQAIFNKVPYVAPSGAGNAAGATPLAAVAPGSIVSIFGANLAGDTVVGPANPLAQTLAGTVVTLSGRILPLFFVSPAQINLQLPSDAAVGNSTLTVSSQGQPDVQTALTVAQDAPGLFQQVVNGQSFIVAAHADGSSVTAASPAQAGETITIYGTGFGSSAPARPEGYPVPSSPPCVLQDAISATINGEPAAPSSAFAAPGAIGIDAVQVAVPADAPSGTSVQVTVTAGGQQSNMVLLPIQ